MQRKAPKKEKKGVNQEAERAEAEATSPRGGAWPAAGRGSTPCPLGRHGRLPASQDHLTDEDTDAPSSPFQHRWNQSDRTCFPTAAPLTAPRGRSVPSLPQTGREERLSLSRALVDCPGWPRRAPAQGENRPSHHLPHRIPALIQRTPLYPQARVRPTHKQTGKPEGLGVKPEGGG